CCRMNGHVALLPVDDAGHHFGFDRELAVHEAFTAHLAHMTAHGQDLDLETDLVARCHRPSPLHVIERHEVHDLLFDVRYRAHHQQAADLRHGLDDEHTGHHRVAGIVALEERLVDRDVLDADDAPIRFILDDPVDQQHRIAM